jgi:O-antigen/teichoic acid export membrane protein
MVSLAMMVQLTDFGVVPALVQRPARDKRHSDTAWTIGLTRGAGINVILFVAAPYIAGLFGEPAATNIIRVLALSTLLQAAASIEIATLTRELRFNRLVVIRLSAAVCNLVVSIVLAERLGAWAMVWGTVAGAVTHLVASYVVAPYRPRLRMQRVAATSLMKFGRWIFLIGIIGVAADAALRWIISRRLGVTELGLFFMAALLAYLPYQLITELVGEVAFPLYSQLQENSAKAARTFRTVFVSTLALLLPASSMLIILIPDLVAVVLGQKWEGATVVMQYLALACIAGVAGDTVAPLLKGMGRPKKAAILDLAHLGLLIPAAWMLVGTFGLAGAGLALLIAVVFSQAFAVRFASETLERPFSGITGSCVAIIGATLAGLSVTAVIIHSLSGMTALVVAGSIGAVTMALTGLLLDRVFKLRLMTRMAEPFPVLARLVSRAPSNDAADEPRLHE